MALIVETPASNHGAAGRLAVDRTAALSRPRTQGGDPRGDPWLLPDHFGKAIHEVISDLAGVADHRRRAQIVPAVSRALDRRSTTGPALRRRLTALATTYTDRFAPPEFVRLLGPEVEVFGVRFDLVWTTGTHHWADEIKSAGDRLTGQLAQQCQRQLQAGFAQWGAAFAGVRIVWLSTPGRELLISTCPTAPT